MLNSIFSQITFELIRDKITSIVAETKQLLREKVWWPGIDNDVETMIQNCHTCQLLSNQFRPPPVNMSKLPDGPWKKIAIDLSGPYANDCVRPVVVCGVAR
jgi:hypothetical protein